MIQDDGIWCNKRIEFVKTQKKKKVIQTSEQIFQICIDCIVHNNIFWKMFFRYVLIFSVKCFICSVASHLLSSSVSEWPPNCCVLPNTYDAMDFYKWKLNKKLQMNYLQKPRIAEHTCRNVGMLLTGHIKFCTCDDNRPK